MRITAQLELCAPCSFDYIRVGKLATWSAGKVAGTAAGPPCESWSVARRMEQPPMQFLGELLWSMARSCE